MRLPEFDIPRRNQKNRIISDIPWRRNLALLWFSQLLVMAGFSAMIPFIPLFVKEELQIVQEGDLAIYVSMFNFFGTLAYAIFNPIWGMLADRFGVKPMLLRGTFLTAFIFPLMGYVHHIGLLIFLRFLSAACAGTTAASQTMIARTVPDKHQGFAQGVLTTAIWGGAMLGNVIGGLIIYYFNYLYAFWFCGILYFIAGFSIIFTRDDFVRAAVRNIKKYSSGGIMTKLFPSFTNAVWMLLMLFLLMGLMRNFEAPYIALKIEQLSSKETAAYWTGIVSAVVCCGAIFSGALIGWMSDRLPPRKIMIPVLLVSAIALLLQGIATNLYIFAAARTLLYLAAGGLQPILQKILSGSTPKRKRGSVFGFASSFNSIGAMLAAVFSGWSIFIFKLNGVFYIGALLFLLALPLFLSFLKTVINQPFYQAHNAGNSRKK